MLGRFATDQCAACLHAPFSDAAHDFGHALRRDPAADDVVGHEERLRAADHQVIDDHSDEVDADRAVTAGALGDQHLGADAVGGGGQHRPAHHGEPRRVEQPGEAADPADHRRPDRLRDRLAHQRDRTFACLNVHASAGVA